MIATIRTEGHARMPDPSTTTDRTLTWKGQVKGRDMQRGLLYVECYLPADLEALAQFEALAATAHKGSYVAAAKANPELAAKALTPIDSHGEAMLQDDVIALAHLVIKRGGKMDVMHSELHAAKPVPSPNLAMVQSFVNTPEIGSPNFWPGAWCAVIEVKRDTPEWADVVSGKLNAVSFMAVVTKVPVALQVLPPQPPPAS